MLRDVIMPKVWAGCLLFVVILASNKALALLSSEVDWLKQTEKVIKGEKQESTASLVENALKQEEAGHKQAEEIVETTRKSISAIDIKSAQKLVSEVQGKQKEFSVSDFGLSANLKSKIANKDGVNIGELLSKYNSKDFLEKESDKLPGLMVFISLSMPENSLKQLAVQVRKANGILVLRGIYQGSLQKTIRAIYELNNQGVKAIIHPEYFKKYDVTSVPVFVLENKKDNTCKVNKCTRIYDRLSGNVSLNYALEQFYEGGSNKDIAKYYLERAPIL